MSLNKTYLSLVRVGRATAWMWIIVCIVFASCARQHKKLAPAIKTRDSLPVLATYGVNTLVSDSGIIRFRLKAKEWLIFDKKHPSYWSFEKGIYVEQFDSTFHINASIKADTAYFFDQERLWRLKGHVAIKNQKGEKFNTEELYWNQSTQKVYSDKFIRIEQIERIITGTGFESNQEMTVWKIKNISGIFYVSTHSPDTTKAEPVK
jgi:LPS export ABC transporter protein LptC